MERESRWEVGGASTLPVNIVGRGASVDRETVDLNDVYYDTADHDLQSHGVSLRRRDGEHDGWQVDIAATTGRVQLRFALSEDPPEELTNLLTGMRLGKTVTPVATIHTQRDRYRFHHPDRDALQVELVDDLVRAFSGQVETVWREFEVLGGSASNPLTKTMARRLVEAGARPARYSSKLHRILHAPARSPLKQASARRALTTYVRTQIDAIFTGDLGLRRGQDPIHDTRVATRRLRSTLRVFDQFFDETTATHVDTELKWFAGLLGQVRDQQLQRRRFDEAIDKWPPELILGPVASRIHSDLHGAELRARGAVSEAMDAPRYLALLTMLQQWFIDLPVKTRPRRTELETAARKARHKADRRLAAALRADDDALLHRSRKAAKRARYASDLCAALPGESLQKSKRYKRIQRVLGDFQDSAVAAAATYRMGVAAGSTSGENGFTFGLLHARERQLQDRIRSTAINEFG